MLILIIILLLVFGGGGGYYGYSRWGTRGGGGIGLGTILLIGSLLTSWVAFASKLRCQSAFVNDRPWSPDRMRS